MQAADARPRLQRVRTAWDQIELQVLQPWGPTPWANAISEGYMMTDASVSIPFEEYAHYSHSKESQPLTSNSLIHSDLFTFIVGKERKTFVLHSKAIAATSPQFSALVNGGLSEAQTRTAELEDIDPGTFDRFVEYAYRRDYTVPTWTRDEGVATPDDTPPTPPEPEVEPPVTDFDTPPPAEPPAADPPRSPSPPLDSWGSRRKPTKKHKKITMRSNFTRRVYLHDNQKPRDALLDGFEPTSNSSADQDFTSIFLAHAQLYTLADMRLVLPLKTLALHKLHSTLSSFSLYEERLGDVLELARYAYSQGEGRSEDGKLDELRELVVRYIACEPKAFSKHQEFKYMMDSEGEFAGDLFDIITLELL